MGLAAPTGVVEDCPVRAATGSSGPVDESPEPRP
jgi:hypothetical protein